MSRNDSKSGFVVIMLVALAMLHIWSEHSQTKTISSFTQAARDSLEQSSAKISAFMSYPSEAVTDDELEPVAMPANHSSTTKSSSSTPPPSSSADNHDLTDVPNTTLVPISTEETVSKKKSDSIDSEPSYNETRTDDEAEVSHDSVAPLQNMTTLSPEDTFSACLLIMDDNHRLNEWIAYHWYALPLRYLVVATDPNAKTSPSEILDKWRPYLEVVEWGDEDYLLPYLKKDQFMNTNKSSTGMKTSRHRKRQEVLYSECTRHMMARNLSSTWTIFIDIDEYITVDMDSVTEDDRDLNQSPGSILKMMRKYKPSPWPRNLTKDELKLPAKEKSWFEYFAENGPCVSVPRAAYSAVESEPEVIAKGIPEGLNIDPMRFDTLRFRYRGHYRAGNDGPSKALLDASYIEEKDLGPVNAHKPLNLCPKPFNSYGSVPLGIHHFLGSWESYSFRDDARRGSFKNYDDWKKRAEKKTGGADDELRPWVAGFVREVGIDAANVLLQGNGLLPEDVKKLEESSKDINETTS